MPVEEEKKVESFMNVMALSGKVHLRSELKIESDWEDEWALLMKELRWLRKKK